VFTQGHNAVLGMRELPAPACRLLLRTATAQRWTHPGCESVLPARRPGTPHPGVPGPRAWTWSLPKAACRSWSTRRLPSRPEREAQPQTQASAAELTRRVPRASGAPWMAARSRKVAMSWSRIRRYPALL